MRSNYEDSRQKIEKAPSREGAFLLPRQFEQPPP